MNTAAATSSPGRTPPRSKRTDEAQVRLRAILEDNYRFVWRAIRRLGVADGDVDDVAQQVFIVCSDNLARVEVGKERAFLISSAVRLASNARRAVANRRIAPDRDDQLDTGRPSAPDQEALLDQKRTRQLLDDVLASLSLELRTVFVLYEIEQMSSAEIAELLNLPIGTVASRLRRAREQFTQQIDQLRALHASHGGVR